MRYIYLAAAFIGITGLGFAAPVALQRIIG
jgi:hypothetical protein